jgi:anaerobic selenocysteine-containing dehydrogenase
MRLVIATIRTMCPMNCHPALCGMLVEVEDGHCAGVHGDPDNPDSRGFLCIRGQASREIIGNPRRLLAPLLRARRGDKLRSASWDEDSLPSCVRNSLAGADRLMRVPDAGDG